MTFEKAVEAGVGWDTAAIAQTWPGRPALDGDVEVDLCVVGLGGSGLAAVDEALERGLTVVGVDAGRVAAGAAGRNGGILAGGGAMILSEETEGVTRDDKIELYRQTQVESARLAAQLGEEVVRRAPVYEIAGFLRGPRDDAERAVEAQMLPEILAEVAALRDAGFDAEEYDGEWGRGLVVRDAAAINPAVRALSLANHLTERGAMLHEFTPVRRFQPGAVITSGGTIRAERTVVAVDGNLDRLLPQVSSMMQNVRLQMLATAPLSRRITDGSVGARDGFEWLQQDAEGRLLIGGGRDQFLEAENTTDNRPTEQVQAWIERQAERAAGEPVEVTHRWAATVGYTTDRRALCVPMGDGVVGCGAYSGSGNLVGPVATRAAVAHLVDGTPVPAYFRSDV